MNKNVAEKIIKVALPVATLGLTLLSNHFKSKELDDTVAEKVAEALKAKAEES